MTAYAVYPLDIVLFFFVIFCIWYRFLVWLCNNDIAQHMKSTGLSVLYAIISNFNVLAHMEYLNWCSYQKVPESAYGLYYSLNTVCI